MDYTQHIKDLERMIELCWRYGHKALAEMLRMALVEMELEQALQKPFCAARILVKDGEPVK